MEPAKESLWQETYDLNGIDAMLVLSWILNTVSQDLSTWIVFGSNAYVVWEDLKERSGMGTKQAANSATVETTSDGSGQLVSTQVPSFTVEQYQQILSLLEKDPIVKGTAHMAGFLQCRDEEDW
ncbi:hypothetical protein HRI_001760300 [Hibiscus trionum]|uniref:Uncharacterized protein n=1 Tax=Hibiscus trionum TaxID=183268 RepID=A0A9W7HN44_HIBTR|nr:hypothetical protein HRI_001760300 [Hibiscus trionum]